MIGSCTNDSLLAMPLGTSDAAQTSAAARTRNREPRCNLNPLLDCADRGGGRRGDSGTALALHQTEARQAERPAARDRRTLANCAYVKSPTKRQHALDSVSYEQD